MKHVTINKKPLTAQELTFLANLANTDNKEALQEIILDYQRLTYDRTDLDPLFPEMKDTDDIDHFFKIHQALSIAHRYDKHFKNFNDFLKSDTQYLGLTLSDVCDKYRDKTMRCNHCAAGKGKNQYMDIEGLKTIDPEFFTLFQHAAIGRKGEPMLYKDKKKDISDVVEFIIGTGIKEISMYTGVFNKDNKQYKKVADRLTKLKENSDIIFTTGFTYHPFAPDQEMFNEGFKYAFDTCFPFSDELSIELLASEIEETTSMQKLEGSFKDFRKRLFRGYYETNDSDTDDIMLTQDRKKVRLSFKQPNTNIYNIGEYAKTLKTKNLQEKYTQMMGEKTYPPICASTLNHEYIVIEPDGGIKTCVSFDGMHKRSQFNIFKGGYRGLIDWLEDRFHDQRKEIIKRLPDLVYRKHTMCDCK